MPTIYINEDPRVTPGSSLGTTCFFEETSKKNLKTSIGWEGIKRSKSHLPLSKIC